MKRSWTLAALSLAAAFASWTAPAAAQPERAWYVQDEFRPNERLELRIKNDLTRARVNSPVTILREQITGLPDVHELALTLVDPSQPGRPRPSDDLFARQGGHETRQEANGRWIPYQLDDLNEDGIWDELFFMADFAAGEEKVFHLYVGFQNQGWERHRTHAGIGSYVRHTVPFWESENIGWKLWFPDSIDVFGKREAVLMSHRLYMENLDGYGVSFVDPAFGSDIMQVNNSFGGGGIGVFDNPQAPDVVSRPRFTPRPGNPNFNGGPVGDTRYHFGVVTNGPVRSMIRARTFNWNTGAGSYAVEQIFTAYAGESYATSRVRFLEFAPQNPGATFAVGIRKHVDESHFIQRDGIVISGAPEAIRNLDDQGLRENGLVVDYAGTALVVKRSLAPEYQYVPGLSGNHTFRIQPNASRSFEYLIAAGWSEGLVNRTPSEFEAYVLTTAEDYNSPVRLAGVRLERKSAR